MNRFRNMSLGSTINVIVFPCVIILSALISLNNMISLRATLNKEFKSRIMVMGESLSWSSADQLAALEAFNDITIMRSMATSLKATLESIIKQDDISYAAITLADGNLLAGADREGGREFTMIDSSAGGELLGGRYEIRDAGSRGWYEKEARFPIVKDNARIGTLVIGYSEATIHKQLRKTVLVSMLTGLVGSLLLAVLIAVIMRRLISVPVKDAAAILEKMANNDFSDSMTREYTGEHTIIRNSINRVLGTLNESLRQVAESTDQVSVTAEELSSTAQEMAAEAQQQMSQTALVASSMEKMSETIQEIAAHSNSAVSKAKEAGMTAMNGGKIVEATVGGMRRIERSVQELQEVIRGLSTDTEKIGDIISVIADVTDQTNLLALNAAIEAARAGEQGRGFAVVADEVRKLAERTSLSTKEIVQKIQGIQGDTKKAVTSMDTSVRDVQAGLVSAEQAGNALQEIVVNAGKVQDMVLQIAMAADQQAAATKEILTNVEAISAASKQNACGAQETSDASQGLNKITGGLKAIVESFMLHG